MLACAEFRQIERVFKQASVHVDVPQSSGLSDQNHQLIGENFNLRNILSEQTKEIFNYQQMVKTLGISLEKNEMKLISCLHSKSLKITNHQPPTTASIMNSTTKSKYPPSSSPATPGW